MEEAIEFGINHVFFSYRQNFPRTFYDPHVFLEFDRINENETQTVLN